MRVELKIDNKKIRYVTELQGFDPMSVICIETIQGGGVGGSWDVYPRPLLYDDGWGLGITPHDLPLDADLTLGSSNYFFDYSRVGQGTSNSTQQANIGGGSCANRGATAVLQRGGIGAGGGGGYNTYTASGGPGAVIVEVLS